MNYRDEMDEGTVFLEPEWLDEAIVGYANVNGHDVLAYGYSALITAFMKHDDMDYETAVEWVDYNTLRALPYMGAQAPIVVYLRGLDEI